MVRSTLYYFTKGKRKQGRYFKRNLLGCYIYFAYAIASIVGNLTMVGFPLFSSSSFNMARMLDQTDDAYITKSFDGGDEPKHYLPRFLFGLFASLVAVAIVAATMGLASVVRSLIHIAVPTTEREAIFSTLFAVIVYAVGGIALVVDLLFLQAGSYVGAKNASLSVGDIAYEAANFVNVYGVRLFFLDLIALIHYSLFAAPFVVAMIVLHNLAMADITAESYKIYETIRYIVMLNFAFLLPIMISRFHLTLTVSSFYLFEDGIQAVRRVIIYPERKEAKDEPSRGRYLEIVPLDSEDEDLHPMTVNSRPDDAGEKQ